jgi:hypothetical protein
MTVTINIPSQLPALTGNANLFLRVNAGENGIEWAATAGGGITIDSTAITSGTAGRVLFENSSNQVSQSSLFTFSNNQLAVGVAAIAATRFTVAGINADTSAHFVARFTNIAGTTDYFALRGDGFVGVGTASPVNSGQFEFVLNQNGNTRFNISNNNAGTSARAGLFIINNLGSEGSFQITSGGHTFLGTQWANVFRLSTSTRGIQFFTTAQITDNYDNSIVKFYLNGVNDLPYFGFKKFTSGPASSVFYINNNNTANAEAYITFASQMTGASIAANTQSQIVSRSLGGNSGILSIFTNNGTTPSEVATFTNTKNVLIGTTTDVASSILTLQSSSKGVLIPRMTTAQRDAISSPATGLLLYNTSTNEFNYYNGSSWRKLNDSPG